MRQRTVLLPRRKRAVKMNVREPEVIRCAPHLAWVRGHVCMIDNDSCSARIEAAHIRTGTDGGTGQKPGDCYAVPLCSFHHRQQHQYGERTFWFSLGFGEPPVKTALKLWQQSPAGRRWRAKRDEEK